MTFIGNCYVIAPLHKCAARADMDSDANSNFFIYVIKYKYDICFISLWLLFIFTLMSKVLNIMCVVKQ